MGKRMRMTLPKKEEDLQKVVEEVMETQHEHHHHHHHAVEGIDEILHTIDVLMDTMNTRVVDVEERTEILHKEVITLYKLFSLLTEAIAIEDRKKRNKILEQIKNTLIATINTSPQK